MRALLRVECPQIGAVVDIARRDAVIAAVPSNVHFS